MVETQGVRPTNTRADDDAVVWDPQRGVFLLDFANDNDRRSRTWLGLDGVEWGLIVATGLLLAALGFCMGVPL